MLYLRRQSQTIIFIAYTSKAEMHFLEGTDSGDTIAEEK